MAAAPPTSVLPDDFEELDFSIEEEVWNEYELSENTRVKARIILNKVVRNPNNPADISFTTQQPFFITYAPSIVRGERNNPPQPNELNNLPNYEVRITRSDERWNRYRILRTGHTVRLRLMVTEIRRVTNRFDIDGIPLYLVASGPSFMIGPPQGNIQP